MGVQLAIREQTKLGPLLICRRPSYVVGKAPTGLHAQRQTKRRLVPFEQPVSRVERDGLPEAGCPFYHVHSLAPRPSEVDSVLGTTEYGERFATIVQRENVSGVQFHPEKSSGHGLQLLANFLAQCAASAQAPGVAGPAA